MLRIFKNPLFYLTLILIFGSILRFYNVGEYIRFLGDEGRDALIVKQMITDHKWTLLGPTASVGGFYTGPIYYYFMLPFLWLFNLNPVGPVYMAAFFGVATIYFTYVFCKNLFNERVALFAAFLVAISPKMIEISRFSWNPNPVPFFSVACLLCLYFSVAKKKKLFTFLAGICVGVLVQLHYIDLVFGLIIGVASLLIFPRKEWFIQILLVGLGFAVGDSLFILFELRHGFPNTRSVLEFLTRPSAVSPRSLNPLFIVDNIGVRLYDIVFRMGVNLSKVYFYLSVVFISTWSLKNYKQKSLTIKIIFVWLLLGIFGVGFYRGSLLEHYFSYLFVLPFILIAVFGDFLLQKKKMWVLFFVGVSVITYFSVKNMYFWTKPNNIISQTEAVSRIAVNLTDGKPFNFALIAPGNSDHAYRYFLDVWNHRPVVIEDPISDPDRKSVMDQLIVVCEQKCGPLGYSLWEVAGFGRGEIEKKVDGPAGITVYKLIHYKE